jgi:FkbM family methyltransferase
MIEKLRYIIHRCVHRVLIASAPPKRLGNDFPWTIVEPPAHRPMRWVISGGVGADLSFERALADGYGAQVLLFDPSPPGRATAEAANLPPAIQFRPLALAKNEEGIRLRPPNVDGWVSWQAAGDESGEFMPSTSIPALVTRHAITQIDLLKLDIEGFEYEVLEDALKRRLPIAQICVEIHQGAAFGKSGRDRWRLIGRLLLNGYRLVHQHQRDYTFVHSAYLKQLSKGAAAS